MDSNSSDFTEAKLLSRCFFALCRSTLGLYKHVTSLTWRNIDATNISGTISDSRSRDVRDFDLDTQRHTKFEIAQKLWGML